MGELTTVAIVVALLCVPSYLIANHRAHSLWRRLVAAVVFPGILFLWASGFPTYPPGENKDDWRRGCFMGLARITAIASTGLQVAIVCGRVLLVRRRSA